MVVYEIYIKSFNDSNNDGIGDLKGIIEKLEYLKYIGVDAIWITPFYPSPMVDNGYDVSDYKNIKAEYGNIEDFELMITMAKKIGIKVIIDIVFNHSSNEHEWFKKSVKKEGVFKDYYIWEKEPLNNWESMFKGPTWTYNNERGEYYLHRFSKEQPDLNFLNENVIIECIEILNYWKALGVDGFRFDVINFLISDREKLYSNDKNDMINHNNTFDIIRRMKKEIIKKYNDTIFIGEVGSEDLDILTKYVGDELMDYVFSFNIGSIKQFDLKTIAENINKTYEKLESPTIFFSSHDMSRYYRRLCEYDDKKHFAFTGLICLLKGMSIFYQGDECRIRDKDIKSFEDMDDIQSINEYNLLIEQGASKEQAFETSVLNNRDFSRELIKWNNDKNVSKIKDMIRYRKDYLDKLEFVNIRAVDELNLKIQYSEGVNVHLNFGDGSVLINNKEKDLKKYNV